MLLRRISKHINDQNWFAVVLDFFIVVAGILIAFQITNWSEERALQEKSATLTERLENDFGIDVWVGSSFYSYYVDVQKSAKLVLDDLTGRAPLSDEDFLIAAFRASQFSRNTPSTTTYNELISTGDLGLVAKSELGSIASTYYESSIFKETADAGKTSEYRTLYRKVVPFDVQQKTDEACGDRADTIDTIFYERTQLYYDCELGVSAQDLALAAESLRGRDDVVEALRHRIAVLSSNIGGLERALEPVRPYRASRDDLKQSFRFVP